MHVILFDIDGTLISKQSTEANERERFRRAVADEVGKSPPIEPWLYDGMVDPEICRRLLMAVGLSTESASKSLQRMVHKVEEVYLAMEKRPVLNPGVGDLLETLGASPNHALGVLTGNLRRVAEEKLRLTGIQERFTLTFCSNGYFKRVDLVGDAVLECVNRYRLPDNESIIIVGDTPRDIEAAKENDAKPIGVASGFYSKSELRGAGADAVFDSLEPCARLFEALDFRVS